MRIGNGILSLAAVAASAISAGRLVGFDDAQISVAGVRVKGVAASSVASGEAVALTAKGTAMVVAGGPIAIGDAVTADAQGRAVPASALALAAGATPVTSSSAAGPLTGGLPPQHVFGEALETAAAAGDVIEILLR